MPEATTLTLRSVDGRKFTIPADAYGPYLAVHLSIDSNEWTVTHVPTGYRIAGSDSHESVAELSRRLQPLDWNFTDARAMKEETRRATRATLLEMQDALDFKDKAHARTGA